MAKLLLPPNNNIKITGKSVFALYLMLKNHFQGRRDVVRYNWKMNISDSAFDKRKDKMFFEKLAKKFTLKELCLIFIGNLCSNEDTWIGEISDADPISFYKIYLSRLKSLKSRFEDDVKNIYYFAKKMKLNKLQEVFDYNSSINSSYIFKLLQSSIISFETFIMLDSFLNIIDKHDEHDNIIWQSYSVRLNAYKKLLLVDVDECKSSFRIAISNAKF